MLESQHHENHRGSLCVARAKACRPTPPRALQRMSAVVQRLTRLRRLMRTHAVDAWLAPTGDPHLSEYVAERWRVRDWLSGFRGSAGTLVVTPDEACLWVDPRYHMRADTETAGTPITVFRLGTEGTPDHPTWLQSALAPGATLGLDPQTLSLAALHELEARLEPKGVAIRAVTGLIDAAWTDRPAAEPAPIVPHGLEFAGESASAKLERLRAHLTALGATTMLITALDEVAWLLNLRGADVPMSPVALAYCLVHQESALLFVHEACVTPELREHLPGEVATLPYESLATHLRALPADTPLLIDPERTTVDLHAALRHARLVHAPSPVQRLKARKNPIELAGAASAHLRDGLALTRLLHWLATTEPDAHTEVSVAARLEDLRRDLPGYRGPSFGTIVGVGPNSAVGHYASDPTAPEPLARDAIVLIDCGGHYLGGTTDTTRTIVLGRATDAQRHAYTTVIKSLIALSTTTFPKGTTGQQLDAVARTHLWAHGWECRHGIGHGIGSYLHVHEGPQRFSTTNAVALEPGMVSSCEPGVYFEGAFGVRLENTIVTAPSTTSAFGPFYAFETLTLCPFDRDLIDPELLTLDERTWLDAYHRTVREALEPHLGPDERRWLEGRTRPLPLGADPQEEQHAR
jgi:Xaa-Pro aminopeptidase